MAYTLQRTTGFAGYYRDESGRRRSAGIYPSKKEALAAATRAEAGLLVIERGSKATLREHIKSWLPQAREELMDSTLRSYEHAYKNYIYPILGDRPVATITRRDVEALLREAKEAGVSPHGLKNIKAALGRALRPVVPDVLPSNPTHGIKIPTPPSKKFNLIEKGEFKQILDKLPNDGARLFVQFLVATGCRFGEAIEVRRDDLNFRTLEVDILRRATETNNGGRFKVVAGTKAGVNRGRSVKLPRSFMDELRTWCDENGIDQRDLVFPDSLVNPRRRERRTISVERGEMFVVGGRTFHHGTAYGYSGGGCRCQDCTDALVEYRRKTTKKRSRYSNDTGHLSHSAWRATWNKAVKEAAIGWYPRTHDLRHYYASYLVEAGIGLKEVMDLMGHQNIKTTEIYLHRVADQSSRVREVVEGVLS